ncbi:MFS transporter [Actinoplanes philippinensis]|uniref:Major Facilitator Superfamily protein n=1 Tax=Actinoplanes philippinensis TaxID=35752 RepID=A0A1I2L9F6_9ACTN|nr:MFS transporter [Actinoplanes philippinensis]GIE82481.1 MFS transporter [Actinoplanes philippinensis]SFF74117.1 Major Facilitator Superfamily protein [Actinoplanes philippinensis]
MSGPTAARPRLVLAVLAASGTVVAIMQTIVVPLLPSLPRLTHSTPTDVSWLLTITLLTGAVFTPLLGRAGDMYGKRRVLLGVLGLLVVGSVLLGAGSHLAVMILGRALQGAALAVMPLGMSILRDELPPERVISSAAIMSSTLGIGAAFGIPIAAAVVDYVDWHTMFWVSAVLSLVLLILIRLVVPESPARAPGRFDVPGALGLTAMLVCLLLAVSKGATWGWSSPRTWGLFLAAALIAPVWVWFEGRTLQPLVDLRTSARPAVLFTNIASLLVGFAFYANTLATAQLVQEPVSTGYGLGLSVIVSGLCLIPGGLAMALLSPVSGWISGRRGPRFTLLLAGTVMVAGYATRIVTSRSLWAIVAGALVVGAGTALAYSALPSLIMQAVPIHETAAANGINTLMRSIGQAVCSAVVATILANLTMPIPGGAAPSLHAYQVVFATAGAVALAALVAALFIPRRSAGRTPRVDDRDKVLSPAEAG